MIDYFYIVPSMRNIILFIISIAIITSCNFQKNRGWLCGMRCEYNYPELNIQNFNSFINTKNNKPFDTIYMNTNRIYDNEGKYYFEYK